MKVFDKDHNGYISMSELRQTMKEMGIELSNEEVELMMHRADTNGDGKIDYKGEIAAAVFMCHARRHR